MAALISDAWWSINLQILRPVLTRVRSCLEFKYFHPFYGLVVALSKVTNSRGEKGVSTRYDKLAEETKEFIVMGKNRSKLQISIERRETFTVCIFVQYNISTKILFQFPIDGITEINPLSVTRTRPIFNIPQPPQNLSLPPVPHLRIHLLERQISQPP